MEKELNEFQLRNISLLTHLLSNDAVTDEIVEILRISELDYFSLMDKYKILEKNINIDEKTHVLKFKDDYLTNIIKTASRIFQGIKEKQYIVTLIRFDIDDFSIFNNRYGHEAGDIVLQNVASILKDNSRPTDYVIRFGGEEFDVILPGTDLNGASIYLTKIFNSMKAFILNYKEHILSVTLSAGVSALKYQFEDTQMIQDDLLKKRYKDLQNQADNALYEAKYSGKNRYCVYSIEKEKKYHEIRNAYCNK